jgi:hypothetical protein
VRLGARVATVTVQFSHLVAVNRGDEDEGVPAKTPAAAADTAGNPRPADGPAAGRQTHPDRAARFSRDG